MPRYNLDWHIGWWDIDGAVGLNEETGASGVILPLINSAELEKYEDDLLVERVIGQYFIWNLTDASVLFMCRLEVQTEDETGFASSLWDASTADRPFMWHKVLLLPPFGTNMGNVDHDMHPEWSHLDVKVNRRLSDVQTLQFIIDPRGSAPLNMGATDNWRYAAWIRVLVKH